MFLGNGNQTLVYGNKLFVPTSLAVSMYLGRFARPSFYEHRVSYVQYLPQTFENFKHLLKVLLLLTREMSCFRYCATICLSVYSFSRQRESRGIKFWGLIDFGSI